MTDFYKQAEILDKLIGLENPRHKDLQQLNSILKDDEELKVYFFKNNDNYKWLTLLDSADEFSSLERANEEIVSSDFIKAAYLVKAAEEFPDEVMGIIARLDVKNPFAKGIILEALLNIKPDKSVRLTWLVIKYLYSSKEVNWYHSGKHAAELMVKFSDKYINESFVIAEKLLEIRNAKQRDNAESDFKEYQYKNLLFNYYSKLWEKDAFRAFKILFNQLNNYLNEIQKDKDSDISSLAYFGHFESIDEIEEETAYGRKIELMTLTGLREIGKAVIDNQYEKIDKFFDYIELVDFEIFKQLEMYLLRFVKTGDQKVRIQNILLNQEFIYESDSYNEYILLLRDKICEFDKSISVQILAILIDKAEKDSIEYDAWIQNNRPDNSHEFNVAKYKARRIAKWLYPVKDNPLFSEIYNKHKEKSGLSGNELKPEPRVTHSDWVDEKEGSVIDFDQMRIMEPLDVLEALKVKDNWKYVGKRWWQDEEGDAISQVFEKVVTERLDDYIILKPEEILELKPIFVARYINGLILAFREEEKRVKGYWLNILNFGISLHSNKGNNSEYDWTYRDVLSFLDDTLRNEDLNKEIVANHLDKTWKLIESLIRYDDGEKEERTSDPHQGSINCVQGKAFELAIRFGVICNKISPDKYQDDISEKLKAALEYVLNEVSYKRIRCVIGVWFPQIHLLEQDWINNHIDEIFNENDYDDWNVIWGSYLNWSRAYKNAFLYLTEKGKYNFAIQHINEEDKYKRSRVPGKGLVEHLMIAYFNDWIENGHPLLQQFYSTATPKLKGKAAIFLETGFKAVKEEDNKARIAKEGEKLKKYWEGRIEEISQNPELNVEEAIGFFDWIENTLIEPKRTLELILRTLELTEGKLGRNRDEVTIVQGACKIGVGNELLALKCMNKMMEGKPEWLSFSVYQKNLEDFLDHTVGLSNDTKDIIEIRKEAIELVNAYGRRQIDDLRPYYDKLSNKHRE